MSREGREGEQLKTCCVQGCPLDGAADGLESKRSESQPQGPLKIKARHITRKRKRGGSPRALPLIKLELPPTEPEEKHQDCGVRQNICESPAPPLAILMEQCPTPMHGSSHVTAPNVNMKGFL